MSTANPRVNSAHAPSADAGALMDVPSSKCGKLRLCDYPVFYTQFTPAYFAYVSARLERAMPPAGVAHISTSSMMLWEHVCTCNFVRGACTFSVEGLTCLAATEAVEHFKACDKPACVRCIMTRFELACDYKLLDEATLRKTFTLAARRAALYNQPSDAQNRKRAITTYLHPLLINMTLSTDAVFRRNAPPLCMELAPPPPPPPPQSPPVQTRAVSPVPQRHHERPAPLPRAESAKRKREDVSPARAKDEECLVCMTNKRDCALQCGHVFCGDCARRVYVDAPRCPTCRAPVNQPPMRLFI